MKAKGIVEEEVFTDGSRRVKYELTNGKEMYVEYDPNGIARGTRQAIEYLLELPKEDEECR